MSARRRRLVTGGVLATLLVALVPSVGAVAATPSTVSVGDAALAEPTDRTGQVSLELPVSITPASATAVSVDWRTVAGTAGTADFVNATGTLSIPAGAQGGTIVVGIRADRVAEPAETFTVELTRATGATVADASGTVTIRPTSSGLALGDVAVLEPDGGSLTVGIPATLAAPPKKDVTFGWQLRSATGTIGSDAPAATGTGRITRGTLGTVVRVGVAGDTTVEPDETLELVVTSVSNASLGDGIGVITLRNGDVPPPPADPFGWNPPAGAVPANGTALYVESSTGDFIGQGRTHLYTKANSIVGVTTQGRRVSLSIRGDEDWTLNVSEGGDGPIVPGYWENVGRYPFNVPGLDFSGEGRGCNTLVGRFIVDQVSYTGGVLSTLTLRFEQRCTSSTNPPLRGFLRYDASDPTTPPPPGDVAAFAWHAPAGVLPETGNYLYLESSPGDYIGQGQTTLYTDGNATFVPDWSGRIVQLFVNPPGGWSATFSGQDQQPLLTTGLYENVRRYPFHNPARGGMSFSGNGRGCNELLATFAVDEITFAGTELQSVTIRFVQRCELTGPPLHGTLHWEAPAG